MPTFETTTAVQRAGDENKTHQSIRIEAVITSKEIKLGQDAAEATVSKSKLKDDGVGTRVLEETTTAVPAIITGKDDGLGQDGPKDVVVKEEPTTRRGLGNQQKALSMMVKDKSSEPHDEPGKEGDGHRDPTMKSSQACLVAG
ncbi:hypothetical protein SDRG_08201 [Saprolegnia diclina VS20]|uniref:Uncharacterized protein n=1 Tax=Saprolegnia diclina (strain VS20) TaxID=1156394 RepID=T0QI73_SAPDV|nr:hypothetical protein SDRG_08201 [Saprolegnia diclina VS20]EQC34431.1 hypothetical protein SDRG_08201 [Saprolegnia diclina VS20]|eukprot:XP_008612293.1 hypothetical protein SDRG_08201 [Saprolegnia diclina VS20]